LITANQAKLEGNYFFLKYKLEGKQTWPRLRLWISESSIRSSSVACSTSVLQRGMEKQTPCNKQGIYCYNDKHGTKLKNKLNGDQYLEQMFQPHDPDPII